MNVKASYVTLSGIVWMAWNYSLSQRCKHQLMDKHKMRLNTWADSSIEDKVQKLMIQEIEKRVFIPQYYYWKCDGWSQYFTIECVREVCHWWWCWHWSSGLMGSLSVLSCILQARFHCPEKNVTCILSPRTICNKCVICGANHTKMTESYGNVAILFWSRCAFLKFYYHFHITHFRRWQEAMDMFWCDFTTN